MATSSCVAPMRASRLPGGRAGLSAEGRRPQRASRHPTLVTRAAKTNKRGKVTSRPGQLSKKEMKKRDEEMKQLYTVQQEETDGEDGEEEEDEIQETPTEITDNMLQRIVIFSGIPVFLGFSLFPMFYYLKVAQDIDLPTWVVYIATGLAFGGGLAGISYGVLSASWDPRRKGSALGLTEFQANLPILMESLKRRG